MSSAGVRSITTLSRPDDLIDSEFRAKRSALDQRLEVHPDVAEVRSAQARTRCCWNSCRSYEMPHVGDWDRGVAERAYI